jgi:hypothetical protein
VAQPWIAHFIDRFVKGEEETNNKVNANVKIVATIAGLALAFVLIPSWFLGF